MAYAVKQDMIDRYGEEQLIQLTDRAAEPLDEIDDGILAAALANASAEINAYAAKRYRVPVAPTPPLLRNVCCTLAYYELHRGRYAEETRAAYDDAQRALTHISNGTIVLDVGGSEPESAEAQVGHSDARRQFTRRDGDW